jgi:hypothetical protein
MTQTFQLPGLNTAQAAAIATNIPAAIESLRSNFSGGTAPVAPNSATPVPCQFWADTTDGWLKMRNLADSAWIKLFPLTVDSVTQMAVQASVASLSATTTAKLGAAPRACTVKRLVLLCETASTSSSGNEWQVMLRKRTFAAPGTTVNLFSGTVGTFTALVGVRSPATEFVAHQVLVFTPNQNAACAADDVLEVVMTRLGTATTLVNFLAWVEVE